MDFDDSMLMRAAPAIAEGLHGAAGVRTKYPTLARAETPKLRKEPIAAEHVQRRALDGRDVGPG
jgi:hypothetical protein